MSDGERTYEGMLSNDTPGGYCGKCRQAQIKINSVFTCPNCSTAKTTGPTMVQLCDKDGNVLETVSEEEALRREGRLDKVRKVEARISSGEKLPDDVVGDAPTLSKHHLAHLEEMAKKQEGRMTVDDIFKDLDVRLSNAKFQTIQEAKKILKLRQKLALLKIELGDLIGEK